MKNVLVTGAGGFVGTHVVSALLRSGYEVHAVDILEPSRREIGVSYHQVDLFDHAAVRGLLSRLKPNHLVSLAWTTTHGTYWTSPSNLDWTGATLQLARVFRELGGVRFVGAGTCAEYDWEGASPYSDHNSPCKPKTLYGVSKLATFRILESFAKTTGLSFAWGRVFFLFGAGEGPKRLVPFVLSNLLAGSPAGCNNPDLARDFLHVSDVARAFVALLDSKAEGAVNIASGKATTLGDLVVMLGEAAGRPDLVQFTSSGQGNEPAAIVASVSRLRSETSFRPALTLEDAVRQTVQDYRNKLKEVCPS